VKDVTVAWNEEKVDDVAGDKIRRMEADLDKALKYRDYMIAAMDAKIEKLREKLARNL